MIKITYLLLLLFSPLVMALKNEGLEANKEEFARNYKSAFIKAGINANWVSGYQNLLRSWEDQATSMNLTKGDLQAMQQDAFDVWRAWKQKFSDDYKKEFQERGNRLGWQTPGTSDEYGLPSDALAKEWGIDDLHLYRLRWEATPPQYRSPMPKYSETNRPKPL